MLNIPADLPSSDVVLGHFSAFCKDAPVASVTPNCHYNFHAYLRLNADLTADETAQIMKRAEYPL